MGARGLCSNLLLGVGTSEVRPGCSGIYLENLQGPRLPDLCGDLIQVHDLLVGNRAAVGSPRGSHSSSSSPSGASAPAPSVLVASTELAPVHPCLS